MEEEVDAGAGGGVGGSLRLRVGLLDEVAIVRRGWAGREEAVSLGFSQTLYSLSVAARKVTTQ